MQSDARTKLNAPPHSSLLGSPRCGETRSQATGRIDADQGFENQRQHAADSHCLRRI
jgi:hypothetical protein